MNTANLQLEGLYLVVAALNNALVKKGILSRDEIELAARLLALANRTASEDEISTFSELARMVATTKEPYNDQR